jgi:hypothetical protein
VQFVDERSGDEKDERDGGATTSKHKLKIGHRRIDKQGEVSYKRVPTNALMLVILLAFDVIF